MQSSNQLKHKHNSRLVFDPIYPDIAEKDFVEWDWKDFHGAVKDATSRCGQEVILRMFVDSSHADDKKTCHSRTGYLM